MRWRGRDLGSLGATGRSMTRACGGNTLPSIGCRWLTSAGLEARDEEPHIVSGRDDLYPAYRDGAYTPESNQQARQANEARMVDALLDGIEARVHVRRQPRATAGHVTGFWTWRSLVVEQGLTSGEAVDLAVGFLLAAQRRPDARRGGRASSLKLRGA